MLNFSSPSKHFPAPRTRNPRPTMYPLQGRCVVWGVGTGLIGVSLFSSPLVGFAVLAFFLVVGALWRRDEPPILTFCLALQWLFVVFGYFYQEVTGRSPTGPPGDFDGAVFLSLVGLLVIVAGVRSALKLLEPWLLSERGKQTRSAHSYDLRRLFCYVILAYSVSWVVEVQPTELAFAIAGFISHSLAFRGVLLCLLFLAILRQQTGYGYGAIAGMFVLLPESTSMFAAWSGVLFLPLILLLGECKLWSKSISDRRRNIRIALAATGTVVSLFVMGLTWQGGVKNTWRSELKRGAARATPIEKMRTLVSVVEEVLSEMDWNKAFESLAERLSGSFYFSHVLLHVPDMMPHENGGLTMRALEHTFKPRFLFPDKPDLGSNSRLVSKYTGFYVAGEESETSIGFSYMAEFYIDFWRIGMFVPLFLWGFIVGLVYGAVFLVSPSHHFAYAAVTVMLLQPFASYEGEIAYLLAGLAQVFIVFGLLLYFIGPWLHRKLLVRSQLRS